ncbi:KpsF/GutQ family sugar-phosphate isomerase [Sphingomonas sp. RHCKR7]|nr:KpsF/GutQ family sugar-phosphate isomerase [Sphingomonas folli]
MRSALNTIRVEREALDVLTEALGSPPLREAFARTVAAIAAIAATAGRLVVTGMGKSGIIGRKIAATMTSTGTPSLYLHPGEASHGDLGMITGEDVVLAISWSGETAELGDLIAYCHRFAVTLIVATANAGSTAARAADICLPLPHVDEACPNRLAPTSSTTLQAVLGDALAIALVEQRGFSPSDFLTLHPGGRLGARLTTVAQLMGKPEDMPVVRVGASLMEATIEMSRKRYGATAVVDQAGDLVGVFTDGDLRRSFAAQHLHEPIEAHMTPRPLAVAADTLSTEALRVMNANAVTVLFVCDRRRPVGALHMHDLLRAGVA